MSNPSTATPRTFWVNSSLAFVLAALLAVTLHELAHAVAGIFLGLTPILSTNSVSFQPEGTPDQAVLTAAAGPLFSLVFGVLVFLVGRRWGRGFGRLCWLWLGLISMMNFMGYLVIAPFARVGDTGRVLELVGAPTWVYVVSFALGAAGMLLLARLLATQVVRYCRAPEQMRALVLFAWLTGTAVYVALTLANLSRADVAPADYLVILAGAATVGIFAPLFSFFYRRLPQGDEVLTLGRPIVGGLITVVLAVVLFLVVAPGLPLG